jgi:hypothetical protein
MVLRNAEGAPAQELQLFTNDSSVNREYVLMENTPPRIYKINPRVPLKLDELIHVVLVEEGRRQQRDQQKGDEHCGKKGGSVLEENTPHRISKTIRIYFWTN